MSARPLGHIPDYVPLIAEDGTIKQCHSPRDWTFGDSKIAAVRAAVTSESIDLSHYLDTVQDQLGGTCVGQALSSGIYMRAQATGRLIKRPSALMIVSLAQMTANPGQPVDGDGCMPSIAIQATRDRGLVAISDWPETPENLVTIPPEDVFAKAAGAVVDSYYRIPDGGDVAEGLRMALRREYFPSFAMMVTTGYDNVGSGVYETPSGTDRGWHDQLIVGYSAILDAFKVLNSWGTSFGDGGFAWIAASYMARFTLDRLVIESTPVEV